jgi:hypothetical protein
MSPKPTATPRGAFCGVGWCAEEAEAEAEVAVEEEEEEGGERDSSGSRTYTEKSRVESWISSGLDRMNK